MTSDHRDIRLMLGAFALGDVTPSEAAAVQAHLEGCAECRAEAAALAPLHARLAAVDVDRLDEHVRPDPALGERIVAAVRSERDASRDVGVTHRRTRRAMVAAGGVAAAALGFGVAWIVQPDEPTAPLEAVAVDTDATALRDVSAEVVPHTWGMEIKLHGQGFADERPYQVNVITDSGEVVGAGTFLGVGARVMDCNLNSSVLRDDAAAFEVLDDAGDVVVASTL